MSETVCVCVAGSLYRLAQGDDVDATETVIVKLESGDKDAYSETAALPLSEKDIDSVDVENGDIDGLIDEVKLSVTAADDVTLLDAAIEGDCDAVSTKLPERETDGEGDDVCGSDIDADDEALADNEASVDPEEDVE